MIPVIVLGLAVLAWVAVSSRSSSVAPPLVPSEPPPVPVPVNPPVTLPVNVAGAAAPVVGAASGIVDKAGASSTVGQVATIVKGVVAGAAGAVVGQEVGGQIDVLLGGDGKTGTGIIARVGGGVSGAFAALAVIGAFGVTAVIAGAVFAVAIVAYAIGAFISDEIRLSYGQAGAKRDYDKQWTKLYEDCTARAQAHPNTMNVGWQALKRQLVPFVNGYMRRLNRDAYLKWMKRGKGLGTVSESDHFYFGQIRGYFIGKNLSVNPDQKPLPGDARYYDYVTSPTGPAAYRKSLFVSHPTVDFYDGLETSILDETNQRWVAECVPEADKFLTKKIAAKQQYEDYLATTNALQSVANDAMKRFFGTSYVNTTPVKQLSDFKDILYWDDVDRRKNETNGEILGNFSLYLAWMKEATKSMGDNEAIAKGLQQGEFDGQAMSDASLSFMGVTLHWKDAEKI